MRIDPAVRYAVVDPSVALNDGDLELRWPARSSRILTMSGHAETFRRAAGRAGAPTRMPKRIRASARAQPATLLAVAPGVLARSPLSDEARLVIELEISRDADPAGTADRFRSVDSPSSLLVLAAVSCWREVGDDAAIADAVGGVGNVDDSTALLLIERGVALGRLGDEPGALACWSQVLAVRRTPAVIQRRTVLARALFHHRNGRKRRAIADLAQIRVDIDGLATAVRSLRRSRPR